MNSTQSFALGLAAGAGLMYFMDPERGRRRRALLRDQVARAGHEVEDAARTGARHARNRAVGMIHEARAGLSEGEVDDTVLVERVRSAIGRTVSTPGTVEVSARHGRVTLSGSVASREVQDLVRTARSVRGVDAVDNRLEVEVGADGRPELQGARRS